MQKFSSFGRKKKQTKIRHRMVMLRHLQFVCEVCEVFALHVIAVNTINFDFG